MTASQPGFIASRLGRWERALLAVAVAVLLPAVAFKAYGTRGAVEPVQLSIDDQATITYSDHPIQLVRSLQKGLSIDEFGNDCPDDAHIVLAGASKTLDEPALVLEIDGVGHCFLEGRERVESGLVLEVDSINGPGRDPQTFVSEISVSRSENVLMRWLRDFWGQMVSLSIGVIAGLGCAAVTPRPGGPAGP